MVGPDCNISVVLIFKILVKEFLGNLHGVLLGSLCDCIAATPILLPFEPLLRSDGLALLQGVEEHLPSCKIEVIEHTTPLTA